MCSRSVSSFCVELSSCIVGDGCTVGTPPNIANLQMTIMSNFM